MESADSGQDITPKEFQERFLSRYCSTSEGITLRGLKDYFKDSVTTKGEDTVRTWLRRLGYDEHLFNKESRAFTLTFHSTVPF
jgi:hypothetical protein